jgi:anti-sigma-K factor RskA
MDADTIHDLTAAYALDALDAEDARDYETHLSHCERCREELVALSETATALAYATEAPAPPPELRARILQQAANERANVVPLRPRWAVPVAAVAAVAACAAVGLAIWATALSGRLDRREEALSAQERVAQILAQPGSRNIAFSRGTLVVTRTGAAALVLRNLADPGQGRTYEAWVADGGAPQPAGLFQGGKAVALALERPVRAGAVVMVTKEKAGGTRAPTQTPFVIVRSSSQS